MNKASNAAHHMLIINMIYEFLNSGAIKIGGKKIISKDKHERFLRYSSHNCFSFEWLSFGDLTSIF